MIEAIAGFLEKNLVVCLAAFVLPLKWTIVRICRDREAEGAALLAVPEDLCYVSLGLVLGDVINSKGAFHHYFQRSPNLDMDMIVTLGAGLLVALFVHIFGQWSMRHFKQWRAAVMASITPEAQRIHNAEDNFITLKIRHMFFFLFGFAVQLAIILPWIHWIAKVINQTPGS
jgi:hypothetical protein